MRTEQSLAVEPVIMTVRGQRVILSSDLARIYGVEARALNQAVRRNPERFPPDFAFHLSWEEAAEVHRTRSQSVILKRGANVKYPPLAFTEHGAIMAATVLNSRRAVDEHLCGASVPEAPDVGVGPGGAIGPAHAAGATSRRARP